MTESASSADGRTGTEFRAAQQRLPASEDAGEELQSLTVKRAGRFTGK